MSNNESRQQPPWEGDKIPNNYGAQDTGFQATPNRRKKIPAGTSTKQREHGDPAAATNTGSTNKKDYGESTEDAAISKTNTNEHNHLAAAGEMTWDEQCLEKDDGRVSENGSEDEMDNDDTSVVGERSPTMEDMDTFFPVANSDTTMTILYDDMDGVDDQSDSGGENNDAASESAFSVDLPHPNRSISSDIGTGNEIEVGNNAVDFIDTESRQSPEANLDAVLRERDVLKKELESRDERMAAIRRECALLEKKVESRDEMIGVLQGENSALRNTAAGAYSSADAATSTKTGAEQIRRRNSPGEDDSEQQLVSVKKLSPLSSPVAQISAVTLFIQACLCTAKNLYLEFQSAVGVKLLQGQDWSLSGTKRSAPLREMTDSFQDLARAAVVFLATPFWTIMSLFMYLSIQHEKNIWMQANALTRKQLLGHVSGTSEGWNWDMIFAIGSVIFVS